MTTATLHANVQRIRFAHHALTALAGWLPTLRRTSAPTVASASTTVALDAQRVRDMAYSYAKTDPGFAADLYAAAARHEGFDAE
jgi:hypothetical protein